MKNNNYVHYGCAWKIAPAGWKNFDASPTLRFERIPLLGRIFTKNESRFPKNVEYGDIAKGLPVPDNSCKVVYCSHILEHLSLKDFRLALINTYRILQPGGIFRFVVPDFENAIQNYLLNESHEDAYVFLKETAIGQEERNRGLKAFILEWLGNSRHLWMWDYKAIYFELQTAGFVEIRRAQFGDYSLFIFKEVEDQARWKNCLGIECKK